MATVTRTFKANEASMLASSFPAIFHANGTNGPVDGLAFDAAATENAFFQDIARNYGSGDLTVDVYWYADTASTGDVRFGTQIACITSNTDTQDIETKAYGTAVESNTTHLGTTGQRVHKTTLTLSSSAEKDSIAAGDIYWLKIYREGGDAGDTMAGDVIVTMVELSYSDT